MKLLFLGDVVGRAARNAVRSRLPGLCAHLGLAFCVVHAEDAPPRCARPRP